MGFFAGTIRSKALKMDTPLYVIVPQDCRLCLNERKTPKMLILLHGLTDNASSWSRYTFLEQYAELHNVLVAMPDGQRSFYSNLTNGLLFEDYIAKELPELLVKMFHVSDKGSDHIIAGLSMGGYGSLKIALKYPNQFSYCGAFSSVVVPSATQAVFPSVMADLAGDINKDLSIVEGYGKQEFDIPDIFDLVYGSHKMPQIYMTCGTEDFMYPQNKSFSDKVSSLPNIDFVFEQWGGMHEYSFWDTSLKKMFDRFLKEDKLPF